MRTPSSTRLLRVSGSCVVVALVVVAVAALVPVRTPTIEGQAAVASLEPVRIGGVNQWLSIRGRDASKPVLLFLHGGPGTTNIPSSHASSLLLEEHFVVVQWDQRGAGKSCTSEVADESLNLEQYLSDTLELVEFLRRRFDQQKIYLVGHSWGSVLGTLTVQRHPELFHAYVGVGQVVDVHRGEALSLHFVEERARAEGNPEALADLAGIQPPYTSLQDLMLQRKWLGYYHGDRLAGGGVANIVKTVLLAREYTLMEKLVYYGCVMNSLEQAWDDIAGLDFISSVGRLEVPVYFFTGRHDYNVPFELVEEWVGVLDAPHVEIVWFENSAHLMPDEEPERFQDVLINRVLPETLPGTRPARSRKGMRHE